MKTRALALLLLAILAACDSGKPDKPASFGVTLESCTVTTFVPYPSEYDYRAEFRLDTDTGYGGVVNEIRRNGELVCVEYFDRAAYRWHRDIHTDHTGYNRVITTYPADVAGAALVDGYAVLQWSSAAQFNQNILPAGYTPQGSVTRSASTRVHWSIDAAPAGVTIFLNGDSHFFPHR